MEDRTMTESHREKYARYVELLGREHLLALLPKPTRPWRDLLAEDEHLNNVPLALWDRAHEGVEVTEPCPCCGHPRRVRSGASVFKLYQSARRAGMVKESGGWSLSNSVCTLKELARQLAEAGD